MDDCTTITYTYRTTVFQPVSITLPLCTRWVREDGCRDIVMRRAVAVDCPLRVTVSIRTDGRIHLFEVAWGDSFNTYWHLYDAPSRYVGGRAVYDPITDAQARTLALIFAHRVTRDMVRDDDLPLEFLHGLGGTPQELLAGRGGVVGVLESLGVAVPALA